MIAPRALLLVVALALTAQADLLAQQEPPIVPGDRLRVTAPSIEPDRLEGTLIALSADTCMLQVESGAEQLALPLNSVTTLAVWRERESKAGQGALLGALILGVAGGAIGAGLCSELPDCNTGAAIVFLGGIGAGAGALLGAVFGALGGTDGWEEVPIDQLRVGLVRPHTGGLGLAVSASIRL